MIPDTTHIRIDDDRRVHDGIRSKFESTLATPKFLAFSSGNVSVSDVTSSTATISWHTTKNVASLIEYGLSKAYDGVVFDLALVQDHSIVLTGLRPSTTYHFSVASTVSTNPKPTTKDATFGTAP